MKSRSLFPCHETKLFYQKSAELNDSDLLKKHQQKTKTHQYLSLKNHTHTKHWDKKHAATHSQIIISNNTWGRKVINHTSKTGIIHCTTMCLRISLIESLSRLWDIVYQSDLLKMNRQTPTWIKTSLLLWCALSFFWVIFRTRLMRSAASFTKSISAEREAVQTVI